MNTNDMHAAELESAHNCPIHSLCSFSFLCMQINNGSPTLHPRRKFFEKGSLIWCNQAEEQQAVFIVCSGALAAFNSLADGVETVYGILGRGQAMGAIDLFLSAKSPYVLRALTDVELCVIHANFLKQMINANPRLFIFLNYAIYNNVGAITQYIEIVSAKSVYERIKRLLLFLVAYSGRCGEEFQLTVTHEELARLVCSDRVSVTRMLHRLSDEGLVKLGNRNLRVSLPHDQPLPDSLLKFVVPEPEIIMEWIKHYARFYRRHPGPLPSNLPHV